MNNDIQNLVNELNSTTPKTQMYMIQLCRSAINNLYDLTDTIEENISSLQNSVVANTSAISGLQGSIDVINTNLNAYLGRIESLETKTTNISKLENGTKFSNNVNVDGIITTGDDIISGGVIKGRSLSTENDNGVGNFHIDDDGDMALYLPPNAGKLITTGNIEQYASDTKLYEHNIHMHVADSGSTYGCICIKIINKDNVKFTKTTFKQWLNDNGFTNENKPYSASGSRGNTNENLFIISGIYIASNNYIQATGQSVSSPTSMSIGLNDPVFNFTDTIRTI